MRPYRSRPSFHGALSQRVEIPADIPVGAVIGRGGCHSKRISTTHGVRFNVDSATRTVTITGALLAAVSGAASDLADVFAQFRSDRDMRESKLIHEFAVARHGHDTLWRFQHVDLSEEDGVGGDPNVAGFPYRLMQLDDHPRYCDQEDTDSDEDNHGKQPWISEFHPRFRLRMVRDVETIMETSSASSQQVKIKVAFGQMCFSLYDASLANGDPHSWQELQSLEMLTQLKPRWSNMGNNSSKSFGRILRELESLYSEEASLRQVLTVYMHSTSSTRGRQLDISAKFHRVGDAWVPVVRRPVRVVHALYNIGLDNDSAFRVRVYARQDTLMSTEYAGDLVDHLEISERAKCDLFSTQVKPGPGFPQDLAIRTFAIKESICVHWRGLRFAVSYMDVAHKNVGLARTLATTAAVNTKQRPSSRRQKLWTSWWEK